MQTPSQYKSLSTPTAPLVGRWKPHPKPPADYASPRRIYSYSTWNGCRCRDCADSAMLSSRFCDRKIKHKSAQRSVEKLTSVLATFNRTVGRLILVHHVQAPLYIRNDSLLSWTMTLSWTQHASTPQESTLQSYIVSVKPEISPDSRYAIMQRFNQIFWWLETTRMQLFSRIHWRRLLVGSDEGSVGLHRHWHNLIIGNLEKVRLFWLRPLFETRPLKAVRYWTTVRSWAFLEANHILKQNCPGCLWRTTE
jgi:hypothetical protein